MKMTPVHIRTIWPLVPPAIAALALTACFEDPVQEVLTIQPQPDDSVRLALRVTLQSEPSASQAVRERLGELERAILGGWDAWSTRFELLDPGEETRSWRKRDGRLVTFEQAATVDDVDQLRAFFADTGLSVTLETPPGLRRLSIFSGGSTRASRAEKELVERTLDEWAQQVVIYFRRLGALFDYLERHPQRAEAAFGYLLEERLSEGDRARAPALRDGRETEIVDAVAEAMLAVAEVLAPDEGAAESIDELSRRVFDPFPAQMVIELPGPGREVVGFDGGAGDRVYRVRPTGLVSALERLSEGWVSIDPLFLWLEGEVNAQAEPVSLALLAGFRRTLAAPDDPQQIVDALRERLGPEPLHSVTWSTSAARPAHASEATG